MGFYPHLDDLGSWEGNWLYCCSIGLCMTYVPWPFNGIDPGPCITIWSLMICWWLFIVSVSLLNCIDYVSSRYIWRFWLSAYCLSSISSYYEAPSTRPSIILILSVISPNPRSICFCIARIYDEMSWARVGSGPCYATGACTGMAFAKSFWVSIEGFIFYLYACWWLTSCYY